MAENYAGSKLHGYVVSTRIPQHDTKPPFLTNGNTVC